MNPFFNNIPGYFYETFIFSAIRNFALPDLGLLFISCCAGTTGFLVITFKSFLRGVP